MNPSNNEEQRPDVAYSSRSSYFHDKNIKRQVQFEADRHALVENGEAPLASIFRGVVGYINVGPEAMITSLELSDLLMKHGGDTVPFFEGTDCTHHICTRLPIAKARKELEVTRKRPVAFVSPAWVTDSVKAGKLLPCTDYALDQLRDPLQVTLSGWKASAKQEAAVSTSTAKSIPGSDARSETFFNQQSEVKLPPTPIRRYPSTPQVLLALVAFNAGEEEAYHDAATLRRERCFLRTLVEQCKLLDLPFELLHRRQATINATNVLEEFLEELVRNVQDQVFHATDPPKEAEVGLIVCKSHQELAAVRSKSSFVLDARFVPWKLSVSMKRETTMEELTAQHPEVAQSSKASMRMQSAEEADQLIPSSESWIAELFFPSLGEDSGDAVESLVQLLRDRQGIEEALETSQREQKKARLGLRIAPAHALKRPYAASPGGAVVSVSPVVFSFTDFADISSRLRRMAQEGRRSVSKEGPSADRDGWYVRVRLELVPSGGGLRRSESSRPESESAELSLSQIDPEFMASLPPEIQRELKAELKRHRAPLAQAPVSPKRARLDAGFQPDSAQWDPDVLKEIPSSLLLAIRADEHRAKMGRAKEQQQRSIMTSLGRQTKMDRFAAPAAPKASESSNVVLLLDSSTQESASGDVEKPSAGKKSPSMAEQQRSFVQEDDAYLRDLREAVLDMLSDTPCVCEDSSRVLQIFQNCTKELIETRRLETARGFLRFTSRYCSERSRQCACWRRVSDELRAFAAADAVAVLGGAL